jgi:tetratricopeptide (TPR) repeat protein
MRIDLRKEPYQKLPKWLREGIAVHLAGQTPGKMAYGFMRKEIANDPGKMIDGLQDADHSLEDYAEDGLAIAHLIEAAGPDALVRLESELRGGLGHREAIEKVTGGRFPDFDSGACAFAERRVKEEAAQRAKELELYRDILDKNEKSRSECEKFLALFPKSSLRSAVLYYAAKSAGDGAIPAYDTFIESARKPGGYAGFIDDALLRKARLLVKAGRVPEAVTVYSHLVYWHVGSGNAVTALYEWGLELFPTAKAKSTPLLQRALEVDPQHRHADQARKLLGP